MPDQYPKKKTEWVYHQQSIHSGLITLGHIKRTPCTIHSNMVEYDAKHVNLQYQKNTYKLFTCEFNLSYC